MPVVKLPGVSFTLKYLILSVGLGLAVTTAHAFLPIKKVELEHPGPMGGGSPSGVASPLLTKSLSQVLKEGSLGIDLESDEMKKKMLARALIFAKACKKKSHQNWNDRSTSQDTLPDCKPKASERFDVDPFCEVSFQAAGVKRLTAMAKKKKLAGLRKEVTTLKHKLEQGDLSALKQASETLIYRTLGMVSQSSLKDISDKLVSSSVDCDLSIADYLFANRLEEYFPDPDAKKKSFQLYQQAIRCGNGILQDKAMYRLSLLQIGENQCQLAIPNLQRLGYDSDNKDYASRALYWLAECERQAQNKVGYEKAKKALLTQYPFSLHSILVQSMDLERPRLAVAKADSIVTFRTSVDPDLNASIIVAEALISNGEKVLARNILSSMEGDLIKTEPEFQLYVAVLLDRIGYTLGKFKILSSLFHEHPETVSRTALELYYPHQDIKLKAAESQSDRVNQFLLLSLIRQESAFDQNARSPAGAIGLMQLLPKTAQRIERVRRKDLFDPTKNIRIGSKFFGRLIELFNGDTELALAAYNAGTKHVEDWEKRYPVSNRMLFIDLIPFKETREYVSSIARNYFWYNFLYNSGQEGNSLPAALKETFSSKSSPNVFKLFGI